MLDSWAKMQDSCSRILCSDEEKCSRLLCSKKDRDSRLLCSHPKQQSPTRALRWKSKVSLWFRLQVGIGAVQSRDIEAGTALPAVDCSTSSLSDLSSDDLRILVAETGVFGRATPADKLRLLGSLQEQGHVVLATGDGTNDAPILATADVGESFSI